MWIEAGMEGQTLTANLICGGLRDGSVAKNAHCSCRKPKALGRRAMKTVQVLISSLEVVGPQQEDCWLEWLLARWKAKPIFWSKVGAFAGLRKV